MVKQFILVLAILMAAYAAEARVTAVSRILYQLGFIPDPSIQICPEFTKADLESSEETLWARAKAAEKGYDMCAPAAHYWSLIVSYPTNPTYKKAWRAYIQTFINAGDFVMAMNQANIYLDDNKIYNDSEYIHLLLLRAVDGQIRQAWNDRAKRDEFIAFSMGAALAQSEEAPYLVNLQYRTFLDRYPNSQYKDEVNGMLDKNRQLFGEMLLRDARMLITRMEYIAAFQKYGIIMQWGPVINIFEEALYELIRYHMELAHFLQSPKKMSDYKINKMMNRDWGTVVTSEERKTLSEQTVYQARGYLEQMQKNLPNSPWTKKAEQVMN